MQSLSYRYKYNHTKQIIKYNLIIPTVYKLGAFYLHEIIIISKEAISIIQKFIYNYNKTLL